MTFKYTSAIENNDYFSLTLEAPWEKYILSVFILHLLVFRVISRLSHLCLSLNHIFGPYGKTVISQLYSSLIFMGRSEFWNSCWLFLPYIDIHVSIHHCSTWALHTFYLCNTAVRQGRCLIPILQMKSRSTTETKWLVTWRLWGGAGNWFPRFPKSYSGM